MLTVTTPPRVVGLQPWIDAGVLGAAEVHAAAIIADLVGSTDGTDEVVLAVALAVWAPQHGHACIDLSTIAAVVAAEQAIAAADAAPLVRVPAAAALAVHRRLARRAASEQRRP